MGIHHPFEPNTSDPSSQSSIGPLAVAIGGLVLLVIVVVLFVYLTVNNPGLLDFGLADGSVPV